MESCLSEADVANARKMIKPQEKKAIRDFVERAWMELSIIDADQARRQTARNWTPKQAPLKELTKSNNKRLTSQQAPRVAELGLPKGHLQRSTTRIFQTEAFSAAERDSKFVERLRGFEQKQQAQQARAAREGEVVSRKLHGIIQKCTILLLLYSVVERAEERVKFNNTCKAQSAVRSNQTLSQVVGRAEFADMESALRQNAKYISKAQKIVQSKEKREKAIKETNKERKAKNLMHKKRQDERHKRLAVEQQEKIKLLEEEIREREETHNRRVFEACLTDNFNVDFGRLR